MLTIDNSCLLIIDVQGKLASLMQDKEILFENLQRIVKASKIFKLPILWVEQNPTRLGPTIPEIANEIEDTKPIHKMTFSCCRNGEFMMRLQETDSNQILVVGIETHVCVYQSVIELIDNKYEVHVIVDAVSSGTKENKQIGLEKMKSAGTNITSTETAILELLGSAEDKRFRKILDIIK